MIKKMTTMFEGIGSKVDNLNSNLETIGERQKEISEHMRKS